MSWLLRLDWKRALSIVLAIVAVYFYVEHEIFKAMWWTMMALWVRI